MINLCENNTKSNTDLKRNFFSYNFRKEMSRRGPHRGTGGMEDNGRKRERPKGSERGKEKEKGRRERGKKRRGGREERGKGGKNPG
jgi:hypothetical protein